MDIIGRCKKYLKRGRMDCSKIDEGLANLAKEIRGNELKILDDFCKAYIAAESLITGKDLLTILSELSLNQQRVFKDGQIFTRYWFSERHSIYGTK